VLFLCTFHSTYTPPEEMRLMCVERGRGERTRLDDINKHCLTEFRAHWSCLDNNNQQMWHCRAQEKPLNDCVFKSLVPPQAPLLSPFNPSHHLPQLLTRGIHF